MGVLRGFRLAADWRGAEAQGAVLLARVRQDRQLRVDVDHPARQRLPDRPHCIILAARRNLYLPAHQNTASHDETHSAPPAHCTAGMHAPSGSQQQTRSDGLSRYAFAAQSATAGSG